LAELIPSKQAEIKSVKAKYGSQSLGNVTVDMVKYFTIIYTSIVGLRGNERYQGDDLGRVGFGCG
jgi:hypothetical protein